MHLRFLGCHHTETAKTRLSSILIDGDVVLDAGAITSTLSAEEQNRIKAVLITHCHYDHIRDLPTLALARATRPTAITWIGTATPHCRFPRRHGRETSGT